MNAKIYRGMNLERNYDIDIDVPNEFADAFFSSTITGAVNYKLETEYNNVLLCALPKSGSTHLWELISRSLGYDRYEVGFNLSGGKFYYPRVLAAKFMGRHTISHCHESPSADLQNVVNNLDLKLIVNTRNLLDALISRYERELIRMHISKQKEIQAILIPKEVDRFLKSSLEHQLDVIIELCVKDCIIFYIGWENYSGDVIRVTYEEMLADEVGLVQRVAEALGSECGDVWKISQEIKESGGINFNKGVSGRGSKLFNKRQKEEIWRKADLLGCTNKKFLGKRQ